MSRLQLPVSVLVALSQLPLLQVKVVRSRLRVPVSSQVFEKPLQPLQPPTESEPQLLPFVSRVQSSVCSLSAPMHSSAWQVNEVTVRRRTARWSQVSLYSHAP